MNLYENYIEKKNFQKWLEERKMTADEKEKEGELHDKTSMDNFIKQYGEKKGKQVYYRTMKRRAMGKGKKKKKTVNEEALIPAILGAGLALGVGARAIAKYNRTNKRINDKVGVYASNNSGRAPNRATVDTFIQQAKDEENKAESDKYDRWFRPQSQTRGPGGRFGTFVPRGTIRQKIKTKVSDTLRGHPAIHNIAMDLGTKAANRIWKRFTK